MNCLILIKNLLGTEKIDLEKSLEQAEKSRREAPSAMESASDTTRARYEYLITGLREKIKLLEQQISLIPEKLPVGPMWHCFDKYILVPEGFGGRKIKEMFLVSVDSSMGERLLKNNMAKIKINSGSSPE